MNKEQLVQKYERMVNEAKAHGLSAPHVELVYAAFLEDLAGLEVGLQVVKDDAPEYVTVKDAAELLAVGTGWIYKRKGLLPWIKQYGGANGPVRCDVGKLRRWQDRGRAA